MGHDDGVRGHKPSHPSIQLHENRTMSALAVFFFLPILAYLAGSASNGFRD
jgi:hypothetical protein